MNKQERKKIDRQDQLCGNRHMGGNYYGRQIQNGIIQIPPGKKFPTRKDKMSDYRFDDKKTIKAI